MEECEASPRPSAVRVAALLAAMLAYSRGRVFAGGCFFAAASADLDSKPGPVADALRAWMRRWYDYVDHQIRLAIGAGELDASTDAEGLGFELIALAEAANLRSLLTGDDDPYQVAASAIRARLAACGAPSASLAPLG
jgi:AcrR family transcriptional regulator